MAMPTEPRRAENHRPGRSREWRSCRDSACRRCRAPCTRRRTGMLSLPACACWRDRGRAGADDGDADRADGFDQIVIHDGRKLDRHHGHEVHRPDGAAHDQPAVRQREAPLTRVRLARSDVNARAVATRGLRRQSREAQEQADRSRSFGNPNANESDRDGDDARASVPLGAVFACNAKHHDSAASNNSIEPLQRRSARAARIRGHNAGIVARTLADAENGVARRRVRACPALATCDAGGDALIGVVAVRLGGACSNADCRNSANTQSAADIANNSEQHIAACRGWPTGWGASGDGQRHRSGPRQR